MKNRDLPITEFLDILQKEYIVAEIRHKIYQKISDRKFWKKVMSGKKEKIEDICFRNKINNIFTSQEEKERLYGLVYPECGLPNFIYKDDKQKHGVDSYPGLMETDIDMYYSINSNVRVGGPEEYEIGEIVARTADLRKVKIKFVEDEIVSDWYEVEIVTRIL